MPAPADLSKLRIILGRALIAVILAGVVPRTIAAQTDEIQVYTGEVLAPGAASLTFHSNYTANGRMVAAFAGGVVPDHAVNGAFEWAYGVSEWFEAGLYLPVYTITRDGEMLVDGAKLRALFAVPHAETRSFFYGVNFEYSRNSRHWDTSRYGGEIRPIVGVRSAGWDLILNPIFDTSFDGLSNLDFAPSARLAYNPSKEWAFAAEHYADFGPLRHPSARARQEQNIFAVVDYSAPLLDVESGVGFGLTKASDRVVLKLILAHTF